MYYIIVGLGEGPPVVGLKLTLVKVEYEVDTIWNTNILKQY